MKILNYVISLSTATIRRDHIHQQFSQLNIPFEFFDAVTLSTKEEVLANQYVPSLLSAEHLTKGEKGCLMSHVLLWKKCVEENLPYISIFEDDVILSEQSADFLTQSQWLEERLDLNLEFILRFETFLMPVSVHKTSIQPYSERDFMQLSSAHFGTAGYLISKPAAEKLLNIFNALSIVELVPVDELIFNQFVSQSYYDPLCVYQMSPAICVQELQLKPQESLLNSQLEMEREDKLKKQSKKSKSWKEKVVYLLTKPKRIIEKRQKRKQEEKLRATQVVIGFK